MANWFYFLVNQQGSDGSAMVTNRRALPTALWKVDEENVS